MQSCLYVGQVRHRRFAPRPHCFSYRLFMVYLDLDELGEVFRNRWLWSTERWAPAWFRRSDYLGDPKVALGQAVRDLVHDKTGRLLTGPIRLLTHLRYFGYCFNPVSFYYCLTPESESIDTIVAEITNTPWNERYSYVLTPAMDRGEQRHHRYRFAKDFHVSPFFPMDLAYDWRFSEPAADLNVHMRLDKEGEKVFDATLTLQRQPITGSNLARALMRYPFMTGKVIAGIYWHAALLKLKRIPFYDHPKPVAASQPEDPGHERSDRSA